jgi:NAD(P)-dependent dehydrogenase (short-subunit alcohol dehydrogenase family)
MAGQVEGKVALVTAAAQGLGRASALAFAREGARVVVTTSTNIEGGHETVDLIKKANGEAIFVRADASIASEVEFAVNKAVEVYGRLDYAHNNVGVFEACMGDLTELSEEVWDRATSVNLKSVWLSMKYEIPVMRRNPGGSIVNTSSVAGLKGVPMNPFYCAHKHGILGLTKAAALAYIKEGIRINCICAGWTNTPALMKLLDKNAELAAAIPQMVPRGTMATSEEVARAVVWLCSDAASYVVGHAMVLDGGESV